MNDADLTHLISKHYELLTDRQRFVLHQTRTGWSSRRIATQLGCSHTTVLADLDKAINTIRKASRMTNNDETIWLHAGDVINEINGKQLVAPYVMPTDGKATIKREDGTLRLYVRGVCVAEAPS